MKVIFYLEWQYHGYNYTQNVEKIIVGFKYTYNKLYQGQIMVVLNKKVFKKMSTGTIERNQKKPSVRNSCESDN